MSSDSTVKVGDRVIYCLDDMYKDIFPKSGNGIVKVISDNVILDGHYVLYEVREGVTNGVWLNSSEIHRDVQYYRNKRLNKLLK